MNYVDDILENSMTVLPTWGELMDAIDTSMKRCMIAAMSGTPEQMKEATQEYDRLCKQRRNGQYRPNEKENA